MNDTGISNKLYMYIYHTYNTLYIYKYIYIYISTVSIFCYTCYIYIQTTGSLPQPMFAADSIPSPQKAGAMADASAAWASGLHCRLCPRDSDKPWEQLLENIAPIYYSCLTIAVPIVVIFQDNGFVLIVVYP